MSARPLARLGLFILLPWMLAAPVLAAPQPITPPPSTAPVQPVAPDTSSPAPSAPPASPAPTAPTAPPSAPPQSTGKAIWDYQKEIGLTDDQVARIKKAINDLQTKETSAKPPYLAARQDLSKLLDQDTSDLGAIRTRLETMANIEIDMKIENLKASRNLHKILTAAQLTKWQDIQRRDAAAAPRQGQ